MGATGISLKLKSCTHFTSRRGVLLCGFEDKDFLPKIIAWRFSIIVVRAVSLRLDRVASWAICSLEIMWGVPVQRTLSSQIALSRCHWLDLELDITNTRLPHCALFFVSPTDWNKPREGHHMMRYISCVDYYVLSFIFPFRSTACLPFKYILYIAACNMMGKMQWSVGFDCQLMAERWCWWWRCMFP